MRKSFEQILQEHRGSVTATTPTATTDTPRKSFEQILQERRTATVTPAPSAAAASGMRKSFNQILQEHRTSVTPAIPKGYYPQQHPVQKKPELPKGYYPQQHSSQKMAQMQRDLSKERYEGYRKNQSRIGEIDGLLSGMTTGEEEQSQLKAERKRLEAANRTYERSYLHRDKTFVENAEAADFAQLSEKRDFGNPTKEQFDEFDAKAYGGYLSHYDGSPSQKVQGAFPETVPVEQAMAQMGVDLTIHDPLGLYLDTLHSSADEGENDYYSPVNSVAGKEYNRILAQGDEEQWGNLTDEEIRMYYYLMNTKGKDAAISFLDGMARELQYRETEEYKEYIKNAPAGEKIFHNAISTVVKPVGEVAAFADEAISHIKGEDPNFNNRAHELKNYAESTRGVTADSINRATGAAESDFITWGDVYQGVMSGVDSALAGYMLGPTGASVVLGMGAASSRQRELYEQGASQEEILAGGLLAGGVEALFEHVSLGYFFDKVMNQPAKTAAGQIGQILLQGGVEASEEYCTTLANYLADFAVRYQTSDGAKMMQAYIEDGYSEKDAFLAVLGDINEKGFHDAVVGMISGVSMSGGPKVSQTVSINNLGNGYIHGTNGFTMQDAIEIGLNNAKGTDAYLAAQAIQKRMENGKRISPYAVGRMVMESQTEAAHRAKTIEQGVLESAARVDPTNQVRLDTKTAEAVAAASVKLNQRVEFATLEADLVSKGLPGSYNPATDTVMLNPRYSAKDILGYTLAHEMTHSTEGTRQLASLERTVQRLMGAQTWQQTVSETRRQYTEIGVGLTDAQSRQEALAHWVGENLFKDGFAKAIVDGDATTGNVFVRTIDRVRRALTGQKDNPSAADIAGLERLFMQAIENKQGAREGDAEYAVSNARVIDLSNDSELAKRVGNLTGTPKYRIIQQYIFENLGGDSVVLSDGKKAIVDQRDAQHIGKKAGSKKIAIISEIKKVVESAELVAEENSTKDKKFDYFWYYEAVLRYGKETFPIYVNVGRSRYDGTYHLYDLTQKLRDTAHRTNGVGRPVGYALENGISNNRVTQPDPIVNTHSMHELAEYAPKTFLPSERVSGDALVGADATLQNRSATDETIPPSVDADTSLYTREAFGNDTAGNGNDMPALGNDAQVVERALQLTAEGKRKATATDFEALHQALADEETTEEGKQKLIDDAFDAIAAELGEEEALRRLYNAQQFDRPTGTVEIDGRRMDAGAYVDAYEQTLPNDPATLQEKIYRLERAHDNEVLRMHQKGTLKDYKTGGMKIDLQLFAARRKLELLQLEPGEDGSKVRQFWEKRQRGTDEMHSEELLELMAGRSETYDPISNQETLDKARDKFKEIGYIDKLMKQLGKSSSAKRLTEVDVAAGIELIRKAYNDGDYQLMMNLIAGLSRRGTELGRAVQAFSMMARMTPEGTLKAAQRTIRAEADYVIGEGADDGLNKLADDIAGALNKLGRLKGSQGQSPRPDGAPPFTQGGHAADAATQAVEDARPYGGNGQQFIEHSDFQNKIDIWDTLNANAYIEVGEIPQGTPLHRVGMPMGKMYYDVSKIRKSLADHNDHLDPEVLKQIPQLLKNPIAIVEYRPGHNTNTVNVYGDLYYRGTPITVGIVATKSPGGSVITKIRTIHARRDFGKQITDESILFLNENKKETDRWFQTQEQPVPMSGTTYGFIRSIADTDETVNRLQEELADRLAATEGTYLTREDIEANLNKIIQDATDVPEQVKRYVLKKLRKKDGGLAQRLYEMQQKGHLTAEATRRAMEEALELPTLTEADVKTLVDMTARVRELAEDPVAQADAMEEIYDFLGAKMAVDWVDRLQAWRKFAMLFNPKTHIRNEVSNAAYVPMRKADSMVATVLERAFLRDPEKRAAQFGWKCTKHGQSILPAIQKKVPEAVLEFKQMGAKYEVGTGQLKQRRKMFGKSKVGEGFNKLSRANSDFMEKRDEVYFKSAYIDALGQIMTAQKSTKVTEQMHKTAMIRAREAVFRAETVLGDVFKFLKQWQGSDNSVKRAVGQLTDVVIPFTNTPANIMTQSALHSPLGLAAGAYQLAQKAWGKNGKETADIINTFAKGITGTLLYGIAILLGRAGLIHTGYGKSEKERAADELAGIQENSFDICGVNVSFDWLQPMAAPMVAGAVLGEALRDEDPTVWEVLDSTLESADSLFELSMLQSLYDFFGGYDAGVSGSLVSVGENAISQSIPTLLGQAARAFDPVQRKTQGDNAFETALNQVLAKIPVLTYLLDPELDVWGNEVYRTGKPSDGNAAVNAAQQFVLPWNTKQGTGADDPISQEILRLYDTAEEGKSKAIPTAITRDEAQDKGLDYVEDNRALGIVNRQAVEDFIHDRWPYQVQETLPNGKKRNVVKYYSEMTDDERRRVLSRIYGKAKETVFGENEDKQTKSKEDRYFESIYEELK